jgi:hypothetical protein
VQPAHGLDQLAQLERLAQLRDPGRQRLGRSAGYHQASPGRGGIFRLQRFDQVQAPLVPEVGVDQDGVIPAWLHPPRFRQRGRDIDLVPAAGECAVDQDPHVLDVIDDQHPQAR